MSQDQNTSPTLNSTDIINIFKSMPGHIYWKDRDGYYLGCNEQQAIDLGLVNSDAIIGKTDYDLLPQEEAERIRQNDLEIMESRQAKILEELHYLSTKLPLYAQNGEVIGLLGISIDIAHYRKKIEVDRYVLDEIIGAMPGHVYWKDRDGKFLGCNEQQAKDVGLTRSSYIGKNDYDLINKNLPEHIRRQHAEAIIAADKEVMAIGLPRIVEEFVIKLDGRETTYLSEKKPLFDRDGKIIGLLGISVDITEHKLMEAKLAEAKRQAETANQLKTEFMLNLQHDIRTPITGIGLLLRQMLKSGSWNKCARLLPHTIKALEELVVVCNELIDFEGLAGADKPVQRQAFSLSRVLQNISHLYMPIALNKGIKFIVEKNKDVKDEFIGDEYRIKKIILNILSNAFKFTESGEISLIIGLDNEISRNVFVQINDTGSGIPPALMPYIFDKHVKGDNTSNYLGSGLGLYMVKKFTDEIGAYFSLDSQVGIGTLARIVFNVEH